MEKILTVEDVATILQVKPITVREMFREKRLRAFKMGKAWRTTESMLREDIECLSKGQRPTPLAEVDETPVDDVASAPTAAPVPEPGPAPSAKIPAKKRPARPTPVASVVAEGETDSPADDTQQLLF